MANAGVMLARESCLGGTPAVGASWLDKQSEPEVANVCWHVPHADLAWRSGSKLSAVSTTLPSPACGQQSPVSQRQPAGRVERGVAETPRQQEYQHVSGVQQYARKVCTRRLLHHRIVVWKS